MKTIDKDGLSLCTLQGNVFASSLDNAECSSKIFMRRFLNSKVAREFDSSSILDGTMTIKDIFFELEEEFGKTSYGCEKYDKEVLFWIGYIYRYFAYTYNLTSKYVYKIVKPSELNELYYVYHTFDPKVAIERILEEKRISFDVEDQNKRLLEMLKTRLYKEQTVLEETKQSHINEIVKATKKISFVLDGKKVPDLSKELNSCFDDKTTGLIYKSILYKEEVAGLLCFKQIENGQYDLELALKKNLYVNKVFLSVVLSKAMTAIKEIHSSSLAVKALTKDDENISIFKELGFTYLKEDEQFAYYIKRKL